MKYIASLLLATFLFTAFSIQAQDYTPQNLQGEVLETEFGFTWSPPADGLPLGYNMYRNQQQINDVIISDTIFIYSPNSGCPADYSVKAVFVDFESDENMILFPESIDPGVIEPVMSGTQCVGINLVTFPDILRYENVFFDIYLDGIILATSNMFPVEFVFGFSAGTEICVGFNFVECYTSACCTVPCIGVISGTVTSNDEPIYNAEISNGEQTTYSDESGFYSFNLPCSTYDLTISADGFVPKLFSSVELINDSIVMDAPLQLAQGMSDFADNEEVSIFPVPAKDYITITSINKTSIKSVLLYSLTGNIVQQMDGLNSFIIEMDTSPLPSGVYFMDIMLEGNTSLRRKVMIN